MKELSPEWLITFLAVARLGRYTAAAQVLGVNHSTVSRRMSALEKAMGGHLVISSTSGWELTPLGHRALAAAENIERELTILVEPDAEGIRGLVRIAGPDAYCAIFLSPVLADLQLRYPGLAFEVISATRPVRQGRSGVDIEIGIGGRPRARNVLTTPLRDYQLALYATAGYLEQHGTPQTLEELADHRIIYYVDIELQVDELDRAFRRLPPAQPSIRSTNVFAHLAATAAGGGIGLVPDFLAATRDDLIPVLPDEYGQTLHYWIVTREESLRSPAVAETLRAILADGRIVSTDELPHNPPAA